MNRCNVCGCNDSYCCIGGCYWVDNEKTLCSQCAINKSLVFKHKHGKSKRTIILSIFKTYRADIYLKIKSKDCSRYIQLDEFQNEYVLA